MKSTFFFMGMVFLLAVIALVPPPATAQSQVEINLSAPREACDTKPGHEMSGEFLRRTARCLYAHNANADTAIRLALIDDLYIKSWSYTILNKGFFWVSVALAVTVLLWPAFGPVFSPAPNPDGSASVPPNRFQRAISAPAVQTSVTALAAFSFAFYAHYKEKQAVAESLMRQVIFVEKLEQEQIDAVVARLSEMDRGFGFASSGTDLTRE